MPKTRTRALSAPYAAAMALMAAPLPIEPHYPARRALAAHIDHLIEILDALEGDPDLEENGDLEPSLGPCDRGVVDAELDTADDEPSLGSFDSMTNQEKSWRTTDASLNAGQDVELDDCDREDGGDTEPNGDEQDENGDEQDGDRSDDDPIFPSVQRALDEEAAATEAATRRLTELRRRLPGLAHGDRRRRSRIGNVGPLIPLGEVRL